MKRTIAPLVALLLALALFAACSVQDSPGTSAPAPPAASASTAQPSAPADPAKPLAGLKIGVSTSYLEDEFCIVMNYGIVDQLEALGAEVNLQNSNSDGEVQTRQIEAFIEDGVDYLFVNPPTLDSCVTAVEKAADAGIKMICFDGGVNTDKGIITHVTAADRDCGVMVGEWTEKYVTENLDGKATILLESWMEVERIYARIEGVKDVLEKSELDLELVELDSKGARESAANVTANYAGDYDLVICSDQNTAQGVISTLEAQNNNHTKVFCVSDWGEEGFTMIKNGNPYYLMTCTRTPILTADESVKALLDYLDGKTLERYTYVPGQIVTAENVDEFWDFENNKAPTA